LLNIIKLIKFINFIKFQKLQKIIKLKINILNYKKGNDESRTHAMPESNNNYLNLKLKFNLVHKYIKI